MIVFLNGRFVPEEQAVISVFDRSFLYGDGLFETLLVCNGKLFRWAQHLERLQQGATFLKICLPFAPETLREFAVKLIRENRTTEAILRISLSRGIGVRGYSPKGADAPSLVMTMHPVNAGDSKNPPLWQLATSAFRLPTGNPLARFKTNNKLLQILARAEAEASGADEALLLNTDDNVAEAASSNFFWIENSAVCTPPVDGGILPGVTRAVVLELCRELCIPVHERHRTCAQVCEQDGVFLSLSTLGVVEVAAIDGRALRRSELVARLRESYWGLVRRECNEAILRPA